MANKSKPRNLGHWSEAQYWSTIRSALRRQFRYWKPMQQAKADARRPYNGSEKRQKWEYQCASCKGWFKDKEIQIDHIIPVGSLKCAEDIAGFLERLTPEDVGAFQVLCLECHKIKTNLERKK